LVLLKVVVLHLIQCKKNKASFVLALLFRISLVSSLKEMPA